MTVYQISGASLALAGDGNLNVGSIAVADSINPFSGAMGPHMVRMVNTSTTDTAVINSVPEDTTYTYADITGNGDASGVDAVFDFTVGAAGYTAVLVNPGSLFVEAETITIDGTDLGGDSPANDATVTVTAVDAETGAITAFTVSGTVNWPQSYENTTNYVLPGSDTFVQVTSGANPVGVTFLGNCASGTMYITPVSVLG